MLRSHSRQPLIQILHTFVVYVWIITNLSHVVHRKVMIKDQLLNSPHCRHSVLVVDNNFPFLVYWEVEIIIENFITFVHSFLFSMKTYIGYQPHYISGEAGEEAPMG